jgi:hypothetical protein
MSGALLIPAHFILMPQGSCGPQSNPLVPLVLRISLF